MNCIAESSYCEWEVLEEEVAHHVPKQVLLVDPVVVQVSAQLLKSVGDGCDLLKTTFAELSKLTFVEGEMPPQSLLVLYVECN